MARTFTGAGGGVSGTVVVGGVVVVGVPGTVVVGVAGAVVVGVDADSGAAKSNRFGELVPALATLLAVADAMIALATSSGRSAGLAPSSRAAAPATCGLAIDVPLNVAVAVADVWYADKIDEPGANTSRQAPKFE
jgi:hypothetical protein